MDKIRNDKIRDEMEIESFEQTLEEKLEWFGHLVRVSLWEAKVLENVFNFQKNC